MASNREPTDDEVIPLIPGRNLRRLRTRHGLSRLRPGAVNEGDRHPAGTTENLVVAQGSLELTIGGKHHRLERHDAILYRVLNLIDGAA